MKLAIGVDYTIQLTREEYGLITKALTGHLKKDKKEHVKAKELGLKIIETQANMFEDKRDAAAHALSLASEKGVLFQSVNPEDLVHEIGAALGVDTGIISDAIFNAATAAAKDTLKGKDDG